MEQRVSRVITVTTTIDGSDGYSSAIVRLYRRSASVLTDSHRPSGTLYYKFATGKLYTDAACTTEATGSSAAMNGWSMTKPQEDADTKLYVTMATATSRDEVDAIVVDSTKTPPVNEWSTPVEYTEGLHTATVMLYKRSATALSAHGITAAVYYRFADGKLFTTKAATTETAIETNKLSGWTRTAPETDGNPLYQIQATAVSIDALDKIGSGEWSSPAKMVKDGQNAIRIDLDNETDMVQTDSALKVTTARTVETVVRLYDGATEVDISSAAVNPQSGIGITVTGGPSSSVAPLTASASDKGRKLSWAFAKGNTMAAAYEIAISYSYNGVAYSSTFTIMASKGQPIFQLKPSYSALPCSRNSSTNELGNPPALSLKVVKIDGQSSSETDATSSNLTTLGVKVRYSTQEMPTSPTHQRSADWPADNRVQAYSTDSNVYIAMFDASSDVLLDRETVPVVKDGENGSNAYNTFVVALYKRQMGSAAVPDRPSISLWYKFSTHKLYTDAACTTEFTTSTTGGNEWGMAIPDAQPLKKIYVIYATAYAQGDVDKIEVSTSPAVNEWSEPVVYNENGMTVATVAIYKRAATKPADTPTKDAPADGAVYTFATGVLTGTLNGWSTEFPASDGNPCWRRQATAASSSDTDTIDNSGWSEAVKEVEDGAPGQNSVRCDLDNEHEDFIYNDAGENKSGSATSQARLYDGQTEKTNDVTWEIRDSDSGTWGSSTTTNATASISNTSGSKGLLTVTGLKASSVKIQVRAKYPASTGIYYYGEFTANKANQDKYDLLLNPNAIPYNPATYTTKNISISATRLDLQGTKSTIGFGAYNDKSMISTTSGKGYLRLFATYTVVLSGVARRQTWQITTNTFSVTDDSARRDNDVYFELRKYADCDQEIGAYTILDYESVPITKAENGQNGESWSIIASADTILPTTEGDISLGVRYSSGNTITNYTLENLPSGVTMIADIDGTDVTSDIDFTSDSQIYGFTIAAGQKLTLTLLKNSVPVAEKSILCVKNGDNQLSYELHVSTNIVKFERDYAGNVSANPANINISVKKIEGSTQTVLSSLPTGYGIYCYYNNSWHDGWDIGEQDAEDDFTVNNAIVDEIRYGLGTSTSNILQQVSVVSQWNYQRMLVPAGTYTPKEYTRTVNTTPLVYYPDGTGVDKYYFLVSDTNYINGQYVAPGEDSSVWQMAQEFEVVLTKMLFAEFARLGLFIVYDRYFFSQYGTLVGPTSADDITVNATNVGTQYTGYGLSPFILNGNSTNSGYMLCKVTFYASEGQSVTVTIKPDSEEGYDYGIVGVLDDDQMGSLTTAEDIESADSSVYASGTEEQSYMFSNLSRGEHFVYIAYTKDGTKNVGNDNATFTFTGVICHIEEVSKNGGSFTSGSMTSVPYGWFDPSDPMAEIRPSSGYKFRPTKCIDALTGEEWSAGGTLHVDGGIVEFCGSDLKPYIKVGQRNGMPFFIFLAQDGVTELYNLGYTGLSQLVNNAVPDKWVPVILQGGFGNGGSVNIASLYDALPSAVLYRERAYWQWIEGYTLDGSGNRIYNGSGTSTPSAQNEKFFTTQQMSGNVPSGSTPSNGFWFRKTEEVNTRKNYDIFYLSGGGITNSYYKAIIETQLQLGDTYYSGSIRNGDGSQYGIGAYGKASDNPTVTLPTIT